MILDIHIPTGWHDRLGALPTDRLLVDDDGRWFLYRPEEGVEIRDLATWPLSTFDVWSLRVKAGDVMEHAPRSSAAVDLWVRHGVTRPDFLRWTAAGIYEPSIAAALRAEGVDPEKHAAGLAVVAAALNDGDMSVADAVAVVLRRPALNA